MPGTDRGTGWQALVRTLRRWLPAPEPGPPGIAVPAAAAQPVRSRPSTGTPLLWCHADSADDLAPLADLLHRLSEEDAAPEILLTSRELMPDGAPGRGFPSGVAVGEVPSEEPDAIRRFLDRHQPDLCIWAGGAYAPNLIEATAGAGTPMINVNAAVPTSILRRARVTRRALRQTMERFQAVYAVDEPAYQTLARVGLPLGRLRNTGRLGALPEVPDHDEALRLQLGRAIGNRPVWLAFGVRPDEAPAVLEAHRDAARLTHRLLLVLRPANRRDTVRFGPLLAAGDWSVAVRSERREPAYDTQIVLDDTDDELGLWLRVAPVSFLGNSLTRGGGIDPMPAAALGSAIVHGPYIAVHRPAYARLAAAGGAVEVSSAKSLAEAVCEISIPDRAAAMAHAAWQVESEGAEVIRAVQQDIFACLNGKAPAL